MSLATIFVSLMSHPTKLRRSKSQRTGSRPAMPLARRILLTGAVGIAVMLLLLRLLAFVHGHRLR
ncbi:MAG: hypothetical protein WB425_07595 [Terracidiphilus sp.]